MLDLRSLDDLDEQNEKYAHMRSHTERLTHVVPGVVVKSIDNALADICQRPKYGSWAVCYKASYPHCVSTDAVPSPLIFLALYGMQDCPEDDGGKNCLYFSKEAYDYCRDLIFFEEMLSEGFFEFYHSYV